MANSYKLIVFDWDGTIVDSVAMIASAIQHACRDLDLPVPSDLRARHIIGLGLHDALQYLVPDLHPSEYPALGERYRHHFLGRDAEVTLFAGMAALLSSLNQRGHSLAVATGKNRVGLNRALGQTGIGDLFDLTRCADESHAKPHPGMLLDLMQALEVEPEHALMIGDTSHDLLMARNAGVAALAVSYGAHPADELTQYKPLACVHSVPELEQWLETNA